MHLLFAIKQRAEKIKISAPIIVLLSFGHSNIMTAPQLGAIVASRINFGDVSVNDLGKVLSLPDPNEGRVEVEFTSINLNMLPSQIRAIDGYKVDCFVRSAIDYEESNLKKGDVGIVIGVSKDTSAKDRVTVRFGEIRDRDYLNLALDQMNKAPSVFGRVGGKVYSTIDWNALKYGDCGIIKGLSSDRKARDRICVKFDKYPLGINMDDQMLSLQMPVLQQSSAVDQLAAAMKSSLEISRRHLEDALSTSQNTLRTEDVTLISHTHGRVRRAERNILRKELQAAIKYGTKEHANPGQDGSMRWRFTHDGVVYITDETCRHEVTSWRIDGKDGDDADEIGPPEIELNGTGCHAVLIVDSSGSMRTPDVPGYASRSSAVYECLIRDFVKEQVQTGAAKDVVVTLISMSDEATVLINKHSLDHNLITKIESLKNRRPKSHGNYIPALDKALEVMMEDAPNRGSMLLLMFSDGAPSDQQCMHCEHGLPVFQIDRDEYPTLQHSTKASAFSCRRSLHAKVKAECLKRIKRIGQVFGRDRVISRMIGFGPPKEDFQLLSDMASALPRGEFQKLGLNASNLKTAFSSLSSSMTELRTSSGGSTLTPRLDKVVDKNQKIDSSKKEISGMEGWWIYSHDEFHGKYEMKLWGDVAKMERVVLSPGATGLAFVEQPFAEGAERYVYRCTEIEIPDELVVSWYYNAEDTYDMKAFRARSGLRLVAKEAKVMENLEKGRRFHETFSRIQHHAGQLAKQFNLSLPDTAPTMWNVSFIPTFIYCCKDEHGNGNGHYKNDECWVLCEPELDGKFIKWNNNAGAVKASGADRKSAETHQNKCFQSVGLGMALIEESDEEDEDEEAIGPIEVDDVPQAFSHFTYEHSKGKNLVCDLQGVWNQDDGFVLTDPVVHCVSRTGRKHKNGATDKGLQGVERFFETHKCNALCKRMGLQERTKSNLLAV